MKITSTIFLFFLLLATNAFAGPVIRTDILVIGGGTGGTAAGIQSARMGVPTIIAEESTWLGGMLSTAGVSAIDGNHNLPSGIWNEFRNAIYQVYGGAQKVATGWISNTHFEPHVADSIFKAMAAAATALTVQYELRFLSAIVQRDQVTGARFLNLKTNDTTTIYAKQVIEATELGDVLASAKVPFSLGMEDGATTGENVGVTTSNDIIQDLTYVAILKDFGAGTDQTIEKPAAYTPDEFDGACTDFYKNTSRKAPNVDAQKMLDYAKLPNGKYMINWPTYGNDIYINTIGLSHEQQIVELRKAKQQTLRFVYFIQHQLGFKNLGVAIDEFNTTDGLAIMPYYRESRRVKGLARLTINHIAEPFDQNYYRTGIAVGDYPIDHHHKKNPAAPQHLEFYPIPSYNIPLGSLIPEKMNGLIVCEKSISVSNVVNGTTRLQPVVLLTGQAAGILAALSVKSGQQPRQVPVRKVQQALLDNNALLMPYRDAGIAHPHFQSIQKIGATGILKGTGIPFQWANQTWFYPDSLVDKKKFTDGFKPFGKVVPSSGQALSVATAIATIFNTGQQKKLGFTNKNRSQFTKEIASKWEAWGLPLFDFKRGITRSELAVLLDKTLDPFSLKPINHHGDFK
ncbi:MAG: FAD-dependent oxidoreductase [Chitinophagaceae bacterium]